MSTTISATGKPPARRSIVLHHSASSFRWFPDLKLLLISKGNQRATYSVREFRADGGRGYRLTKMDEFGIGEVDAYDVFIPDPFAVDVAGAYESCDCKGFERHGHCKHLKAVRMIHDADEAEMNESPEVQFLKDVLVNKSRPEVEPNPNAARIAELRQKIRQLELDVFTGFGDEFQADRLRTELKKLEDAAK